MQGPKRLGRPPFTREEVRGNRLVTFINDAELYTIKRLAEQRSDSLSLTCYHLIRESLTVKSPSSSQVRLRPVERPKKPEGDQK